MIIDQSDLVADAREQDKMYLPDMSLKITSLILHLHLSW